MAESNAENVAPRVLGMLMKEQQGIAKTPIDGVRMIVNEEQVTDIQCEIMGPEGTPYENGVFRMKLVLGADFPASPPKGFFLTKIFHPNVGPNGDICVSALKKDWAPTMGLRHVLTVVRCLLIHPNPDSALNEEAGRLLNEDHEAFSKMARLQTEIHAGGCTPGGSQSGSGGRSADGPASKKGKVEQKKKKAQKKKSLKRL